MKEITGVEYLGAPLYVLDPDDKSFPFEHIPVGGSCYVIAGNGMFTVDRSAYQLSIHRTNGCSLDMEEIKEGVTWLGKPLDPKTSAFLEDLFYAVYCKFASEAVALLYSEPKTGAWYIRVPEQQVSSASAVWKEGRSVWYFQGEVIEVPPEGLVMAGSAHSHAAMDAFFSGTDDNDDKMTCGLHLVFGKYSKRSIKARVFGGGVVSTIEPDSVLSLPGENTAGQVAVPDIITKGTGISTMPVVPNAGSWGGKYADPRWTPARPHKPASASPRQWQHPVPPPAGSWPYEDCYNYQEEAETVEGVSETGIEDVFEDLTPVEVHGQDALDDMSVDELAELDVLFDLYTDTYRWFTEEEALEWETTGKVSAGTSKPGLKTMATPGKGV